MTTSNESIIFLNNIAITLLNRNQYYDSIQTFKDVIRLVKLSHKHKEQQGQGNSNTCMSISPAMEPKQQQVNINRIKCSSIKNDTTTTEIQSSSMHSKYVQDAASRLPASTRINANGTKNVTTSCNEVRLKMIEISSEIEPLHEIFFLVSHSKSMKLNVDIVFRLSSSSSDEDESIQHDSNFQSAVILYNYCVAVKRYVIYTMNDTSQQNKDLLSRRSKREELRNNLINGMKILHLSYQLLGNELDQLYKKNNINKQDDICRGYFSSLIIVFVSILIFREQYHIRKTIDIVNDTIGTVSPSVVVVTNDDHGSFIQKKCKHLFQLFDHFFHEFTMLSCQIYFTKSASAA